MAPVREKKNTNPVARENAKVGDVRAITDGTVNFWTTQNMARNPIGENPMTPDDLKGNDKPMAIPNPKIGTAADGIMGMTETGTDTYLSDLEAERKASETAKDTSLADYTASRLGTKGKEEMTGDKYSEEGGVDDLKFRLNKIDNDLLNEQESLRRKIETLEERGGGLQGGVLSEIDNLKRQSARTQADLTLTKLGIQGDYDTAKAIADRAIAVQLEKDQMVNDTLKTIYEDNKDEFTQDEQREFESKQAERNRKLEQKEKDLDRKYALVLDAQQNGAPESVIQSMLQSTDALTAAKAGGNFIGLLDRRAKLASIASSETNRLLALAGAGDKDAIKQLGFDPSKVQKEVDPTTKRQLETKLQAGKNLVDLATKYKGLVEKYGFENTVLGNKNVIGQYRSLRSQMIAAYKDAKTLGTLDAGVIKLMDGIIGDEPTSGLYFTKNFFGGKGDQIVSQLDELIETTGKENIQSSLGLGIDPTGYDLLSEDDLSEMEGLLGDEGFNDAPEEFDPNSFYE